MDYEYLAIVVIFIIAGFTIIDLYYKMMHKAKLQYKELSGFSSKLMIGGIGFIITGCSLIVDEIIKIV